MDRNQLSPRAPSWLPDVQVSNFARSRTNCDEDEPSSLPVMVWTHGGGYRQGSANQYGPKYLVQKGIVVVTIQYRLGSLGFLSHGDKDSPGNAALCDQLTALEWVKEHISAFGGDPNKVSLAGHDAGASAVMLLSQSKYGSGLFRSVVAMSGSSLSAWATEAEPSKEAGTLAKRVKCPTNNSTEAVKCLKEVSAEKLVLAESEMKVPGLQSKDAEADLTQLFSSSAPVVDGPTDFRFLPTILQEEPKEGLEKGLIPPIPLLTGITKDETSNLFSEQQKEEILKKIEEFPNYLNEIFLPRLVKTTKGYLRAGYLLWRASRMFDNDK
ncbi:hypothetical protein J437_LFUL009035 [Ladona fulva]|uniref:Carboxylesterase type B domain-containing protein n=1 Tax=Ladona fulva TaxID=123851 RepID=A0A8K0K716_LADFU|nr:hypothetical protein J437_LFUL009035 [Ladona fulva]